VHAGVERRAIAGEALVERSLEHGAEVDGLVGHAGGPHVEVEADHVSHRAGVGPAEGVDRELPDAGVLLHALGVHEALGEAVVERERPPEVLAVFGVGVAEAVGELRGHRRRHLIGVPIVVAELDAGVGQEAVIGDRGEAILVEAEEGEAPRRDLTLVELGNRLHDLVV
jgi:hypothetical protein